MQYKEIKWDITTLPERYVIAHCISSDCAMGAGVVVPICNKHPELRNACRAHAGVSPNNKSNPLLIGTTYRFQDNNGAVYNMFTKQYYWQNAGKMADGEYLQNLKKCLIALDEQMRSNNEHYLGIPLIGCGLDRCKWNEVSLLIKDVFRNSDIYITVCMLGNDYRRLENGML